MKNLHKKKANVFGKKIPVLLLGLIVVAGFGSAALVATLSGFVTADVDVEQPITLEVAPESGGTWGDTVSLGSIYAGESVTYRLRETIHADINGGLDSKLVITITETDSEGIDSCDEIENVVVERSGTTVATLGNSISCSKEDIGGEYALILEMDSTGMEQGENIYDVTTTFATGAVGSYSAKVQHNPLQ